MSLMDIPATTTDYKALRAAVIGAYERGDTIAVEELTIDQQTRANDAIAARDDRAMRDLMATFTRLSRLGRRHGGREADAMVNTFDTLIRTMDHLCTFIAHERDISRSRPAADRILDIMRAQERPMRNRDIADAIGIKSDYTSKVVDRLTRSGYLQDAKAPAGNTDGRATWRELTHLGRIAA